VAGIVPSRGIPRFELIFLRSLSETQAVEHIQNLRGKFTAPGFGMEKIPLVSAVEILLASGRFSVFASASLR
jgi:hypothetical protein